MNIGAPINGIRSLLASDPGKAIRYSLTGKKAPACYHTARDGCHIVAPGRLLHWFHVE
jgi:hypothetical protein